MNGKPAPVQKSPFISIILWLGFAIFLLLTLNNIAQHPLTEPFNQIDEQGHISYAMDLVQRHHWWPDYGHFFMYDMVSQHEIAALNYINHPPTFYWLTKLATLLIPGFSPAYFRIVAQIFYGMAILIYWRIGHRRLRSIAAALWYVLVPFLLYVFLQIGFYNNDSLAMLGGMITGAASLHWFEGHRPLRAYWWMVLGLALATVKLTSALLIGSYVAACLWFGAKSTRSIPARDRWLGALLLTITAIPYAYFTLQFGSPTPETPGQTALIALPETLEPAHDGMRWIFTTKHEWCEQPPLHFFGFLLVFLGNFADQLRVTELTFVPLLVIMASLCYAAIAPSSIRPLARATLLATWITLAIHAGFSWQRYQRLGWMLDSFVRYYFPLLGVYGYISALCITRLVTQRTTHDSSC